jgi:hypothetical protein
MQARAACENPLLMIGFDAIPEQRARELLFPEASAVLHRGEESK